MRRSSAESIKVTNLGHRPEAPTVPSQRRVPLSVARQSEVTREQLLALPTDTEGLRLDRLARHLHQLDATQKDILFLDPFQFNAVRRALHPEANHPEGMYNQHLGLIAVQRNGILEDLNGTGFTESNAVHEAAHGKHLPVPPRWRYGHYPADLPQPSRDSLFEEGYAEFERGRYVEENDLVDIFTFGANNYADVARSTLPFHYTYKVKHEKDSDSVFLDFNPSAIAATIFDILVKNEEGFLPLLRKSRESMEGSKEMAEQMDKMMPGLRTAMLYQEKDQAITLLDHVERRFGPAK